MTAPALIPGRLARGRTGTGDVLLHATGGRPRGDRYFDGVRLGRPGRCADRPVLLIGVFDNSGSITGGNDGVGRRFDEFGFAVAPVASRCRCRSDAVSVLHFDTPTSGDLGPVPVRGSRAALARALAAPHDGAGCSSLSASLTAAERLAAAHPTHESVLVVCTDFELFDPPGTLDRLAAFPGQVHGVALRSAPPPELVADPRVTVTHVTYDSPPGTLARAVFCALTADRPGAQPLAPSQVQA